MSNRITILLIVVALLNICKTMGQAPAQAEPAKKTKEQSEKETYINGLFENDDLLKKITPNIVLCKSLREAGVTIEFTGKEWRSVRDAIVKKDALKLINAIIDTTDRSYIMYEAGKMCQGFERPPSQGYYETLPSINTIKALIQYFRRDGFVMLLVKYSSEKNSIDFDRPTLLCPTFDRSGIRVREIIRDKDWTKMEGGLGHYKNISINPTVYYTLADEVVLVAFTNFECSSDHKNMSQKPKHKPGSPYEEWASCLEDKMEEFHKPLVEKIKLISQKAEMGELDEETALEKVGDVAKEYAKNIISFLKQL